ncbi:CsbD family protein [Limimaricola soesokkakensis]|nr:CsbD family protein [Limimaricola soesokkakensis]
METDTRPDCLSREQPDAGLASRAAIRDLQERDMSEHEDKAKGAMNKAAGAAKDAIGDATGDKDLQNEGKAQKLKGHGQDIKGEAKGALKDKG